MAKPSFDYIATWIGDGSLAPRDIDLGYQPRAASVISTAGTLLSKIEGMAGDSALDLPTGAIVSGLEFSANGLRVGPVANRSGATYFALLVA